MDEKTKIKFLKGLAYAIVDYVVKCQLYRGEKVRIIESEPQSFAGVRFVVHVPGVSELNHVDLPYEWMWAQATGNRASPIEDEVWFQLVLGVREAVDG